MQQHNEAASGCATTVRLKAARQCIASLSVDALRSPKVTHVVALPYEFCSCNLHGWTGCGAKARGCLAKLLGDIQGSNNETEAERWADGFAE
jgi:hypothetical protein